MTLDEAVIVLNRERWRDRDYWKVRDNLAEIIAIDPDDDPIMPTATIYCADAIAIATYLELCEAVKPFALVGKEIADEYAYRRMRDIPLAAWRKLAALIGEVSNEQG